MADLSGKTAIITGASRGIGEAAARHLAGAGMNVVLAARSQACIAAIAAEIGDSARAIACDVADYGDVEHLVAETVDAFGSVGLLVNNAGAIEPIARLSESVPHDWGTVFDINLKGAYHCIRAVLPFMEKARQGTIVNMSSGAAAAPMEGWSHYCASKAAVLMLTRSVEKEYEGTAIRCVGLSPGTVATEMQVQIKASGINPVSQLDPSVHIPPQWVAQAIAWLAGDGADHYRGEDMKLRSDEARAQVGLPAGS